ncbi:MAG: MFS transporter [Dehalococcoidia bacterium]|nr:MFS transporter [Dehalococcoidia bacterium]
MTIASIGELTARQRKIIRAWCMYDWANSGFATSGAVAIFPFYFVFLFEESLGNSASFFGINFTGSSMWSLGVAVSTAIVALSSPVIGVIADRVPIKKALLWAYTIAGSLFTALAFFSAYTSQPWLWLFGMFSLANIGFAGGLVFYNAFLPHVAPRNLLDDVSSRGFAYGYLGGGLLLLAHLILIMLTQDSSIADLVTRIAMASIGVWWFGWALWTLLVVPEPPTYNRIEKLNALTTLSLAFSELSRTFRELKRFRVVLIYLGAYLLFNDGLQTVMSIAGAFAADTLGIALVFNMATILIIQFVAVPGALVFGKLAMRFTTKGALTLSLVGWCLIVLFGVAITPLVPSDHSDFDYQLSHQTSSGDYLVEKAPELEDSRIDVLWKEEVGEYSDGDLLSSGIASSLSESVRLSENSAYSISIEGGALDGGKNIGQLHPSTLGSGPLDGWPTLVRDTLWEPLGLDAGYQFLILGVFTGMVIGGSQALARSLFAQITPETRSGEFFSFFGFMSRASAVFGPILYIIVTSAFDTRSAITSILVIIIAGTIVLKWVDVQAGVRTADEEDARRRAESQE